MDNDEAFRQSIALVAEAAPLFYDNWVLIGSAAAKLAGADVGRINDIDLLLSKRDIQALENHWADRVILPAIRSEQFRSEVFDRFDAPLPIEAMTGFELRLANGEWTRISPKTRIQHGVMFAPDIEEQIAMLKLMNRPKDTQRIAALMRLSSGQILLP